MMVVEASLDHHAANFLPAHLQLWTVLLSKWNQHVALEAVNTVH